MACDSKRRGDICHQLNDVTLHSMARDSKWRGDICHQVTDINCKVRHVTASGVVTSASM